MEYIIQFTYFCNSMGIYQLKIVQCHESVQYCVELILLVLTNAVYVFSLQSCIVYRYFTQYQPYNVSIKCQTGTYFYVLRVAEWVTLLRLLFGA